jgi:predicted TIM-barrel fold metal-dependent hydrolase
MINVGKKWGIEKFVLFGDVLRFGYEPSPQQVRSINEETIQWVKQYPEVLLGFCFLNPQHEWSFIEEEIEKCSQAGFRGIKLEVAVSARDKRVAPIMERAREKGLVVTHHAFNKTVGSVSKEESNSEDISYLAKEFPYVKIVMAHLGGVGIKGVMDIKERENVYVDTSGSQPVSGIVEYAAEQLGARRIIFGSDAPGRDFSSQIGRILGAKIKEKEKRMILCQNGRELLRI